MRQVLALLCVKRRIGTLRLTLDRVRWTGNKCSFKPKLPMSYTAEETRNKLVGITELVKELVLFPGHTRLLPVYVWLIQVFLGLLLVRIGSQTFAYIVFSCEKGMTVMDQMLTAVLF